MVEENSEPFDRRIQIINESLLGSRPLWDEYFMKMAISVSSRASCYNVHSGSVVTRNNHVVATGYNGAPSPIESNCLVTGCRKVKKGLDYEESLGSGECIGVHSEMNALGRLFRNEVGDLHLYTTIMPCHTCAKNMLSYGVETVTFKSFYSDSEITSTMDLFEEAGVVVRRLDLSPERCVDIDLNQTNAKFSVWTPDEKRRIVGLVDFLKDK